MVAVYTIVNCLYTVGRAAQIPGWCAVIDGPGVSIYTPQNRFVYPSDMANDNPRRNDEGKGPASGRRASKLAVVRVSS